MEDLEPQDPREVGGYQVVRRLGAGGMGRVYLARDEGGQQHFAVKVVHPALAGDRVHRERFAREVRAAWKVRGPGVVPVLAADPHADVPWLAAAYVAGPNLGQAVAEHGPLPGYSWWLLARGLTEALHGVHRAGVIHRDLTPGNVLLDQTRPWLIDFGIARAADESGLTRGGAIGTLRYMAPERQLGHEATPASDVFALGAVLAYAGTGHHAYGPSTVNSAPLLGSLEPHQRSLVLACLDPTPHARPSLTDLLRRIDGRRSAAGPQDVTVPVGEPWLPRDIAADIVARIQRLQQLDAGKGARRGERQARTTTRTRTRAQDRTARTRVGAPPWEPRTGQRDDGPGAAARPPRVLTALQRSTPTGLSRQDLRLLWRERALGRHLFADGTGTAPGRGPDRTLVLPLGTDEATRGTVTRMTVDQPCFGCGGTGAAPDSGPARRCPAGCLTGFRAGSRGICPACDGRTALPRTPCPACDAGRVPCTVDVRVPAGVAEGQRLRVTGKGEPGRHGGLPGDLYLTVTFRGAKVATSATTVDDGPEYRRALRARRRFLQLRPPTPHRPGADREQELRLWPRAALTGAVREVTAARYVTCGQCGGGGVPAERLRTVAWYRCEPCRGAGHVRGLDHCLGCLGLGSVTPTPCPGCEGRGVALTRERFKVAVRGGVKQGDRIRVTGKGDAGAMSGSTGDLYLRVRIRSSALRRGAV
ncbi:protein kinase [Streptomyces sp. NBC_00249]|uniref:protein kinase domain-containing protein n=1 Tax=Streptomyces sp. NBC_00249 TaxID=2975690 RepID=UPI00225484D9|nr:DnaJ C-terminal domain-containing protein [Streptomyces sp. NBC_00249]MCX5192489.1 protein kinase [Streptomyces sp. NBC_00249]